MSWPPQKYSPAVAKALLMHYYENKMLFEIAWEQQRQERVAQAARAGLCRPVGKIRLVREPSGRYHLEKVE